MIYGFYFRFYRVFKNKKVSIMLSKITYFFKLVILFIKKSWQKKRIVSGNIDIAKKLISSIYPDPYKHPEIYSTPPNPDIDLSIIVPIYNYVNLIRDNIESIVNQKTKYNYEIILVDDGSTDGARKIVESYDGYDNVKVILQENHGIAVARNTGINNACGKYIMFIDCDDTIHDNMVELLMEQALTNDDDIVMCAHNLTKECDGTVYSILPNIYPDINLYGYKNNDYIMNFAGLPWGKVYKRELWNNVRFLPCYWYEDTIIQFLIFSQCKKFSYLPVVCYEYRWYEKNFSHTQEKSKSLKTIDRYWMLLAIIDKYQELGLPMDGKFYTLLLKHASAYYYPSIAQLDEKLVESLFILACELLKKYRPKERIKLPYALRITEYAMLRGDINLWKLALKSQ